LGDSQHYGYSYILSSPPRFHVFVSTELGICEKKYRCRCGMYVCEYTEEVESTASASPLSMLNGAQTPRPSPLGVSLGTTGPHSGRWEAMIQIRRAKRVNGTRHDAIVSPLICTWRCLYVLLHVPTLSAIHRTAIRGEETCPGPSVSIALRRACMCRHGLLAEV